MITTRILTLLALLLVAGCGFQLRGTATTPPLAAHIELSGLEGEPLRHVLEARIEKAYRRAQEGAEGSESWPRYRLGIERLKEGRELISVDGNGEALEFELSLSLHYRLLPGEEGGEAVAGELRTRQTLLNAPGQPLAMSGEQRRLRRLMESQLVDQLLQRLRFLIAGRGDAPSS